MSGTRERQIAETLIALSDNLVDDFDVLDLTSQLAEDCARLLDVAAVGLLLADAGGELHLLAATSEQARILEAFQLQRDEGPCLDCFHTGVPVSVPDLAAESERWPRFAAVAQEEGFASVHGIPLRLRSHVLGALGLFGTSTGDLDDEDRNLAQSLAHIASMAILQQDRTAMTGAIVPALQSAVASRGMLETAKGVLSETYQIDMEEASKRLRSYAKRNDQHLTHIASIVVSGEPQLRREVLADLGDTTQSRSPAD